MVNKIKTIEERENELIKIGKEWNISFFFSYVKLRKC